MFFYFGQALKNYANFKSRTSRKAYWLFNLTLAIINIIIYIPLFFGVHHGGNPAIDSISNMHGGMSTFLGIWAVLFNLYALFMVIPCLAINVRRFHDSNKSGWWILINIIPVIGWLVNIIFCVLPGDAGDNKYGAPPQDCNT